MTLTAEEARAIAAVVAEHYRPRTERIKIPGPPVEKIVKKKEMRTRTVEVDEEIDRGPHPGVWGILIAGLVLGGMLGIAGGTSAVLGLFAILAGIGGCAVAFHKWRRTEVERVPKEETYEETVDVKVVEEGPPTFQEREVPPTTRVRAVGRVRLTFHAVPFRDGVLLLDGYGMTPPVELNYPEPREPERIAATVDALEELARRVPWILAGDRQEVSLAASSGSAALVGYEREIRDHYMTLASLVADLRPSRWLLPVFPPDHEIFDVLEIATESADAPAQQEDTRQMLETLHSDFGERLDRRLSELVDLWNKRHLPIHGARIHALEFRTVGIFERWHATPHYSSLNFYCSDCNNHRAEELLHRDYAMSGGAALQGETFGGSSRVILDRNTRLVLDQATWQWHCPLCGWTTDRPRLQTHKLLDEVFLPLYDRLLDEHKKERLAKYSEAHVRELEHRKELNTELRELERRAVSSRDALEDEMRRFHAEIAGEKQATDSLKEIATALQIIQADVLKRLDQRVQEAVAKAKEDAEQTAKRRAEFEKRMKDLSNVEIVATIRLEGERGDAPLRAAAERARAARDGARSPEADTIAGAHGIEPKDENTLGEPAQRRLEAGAARAKALPRPGRSGGRR